MFQLFIFVINNRVIILYAFKSYNQQTQWYIATTFNQSKQNNLSSSVLTNAEGLYHSFCLRFLQPFGIRGQAIYRSHHNLRPMVQWEVCL